MNPQQGFERTVDPNTHLPRQIHAIGFNSDALKNTSKGALTKLIPGTVLEREYYGETYVVYYGFGYDEYSRKNDNNRV